MRLSRAALASVVLAAAVACDTAVPNRVGTIAGPPTDALGRALLEVSPTDFNLAVGSTFQLTTNAPVDLLPLVQWSVLDQTIASVSPTGVVLGQTAGTTRIVARYSDDTTNAGSAKVTIVGTGNTGDRIP